MKKPSSSLASQIRIPPKMRWRYPQIKRVRVKPVTRLSDRVLTTHAQCPDFHTRQEKNRTESLRKTIQLRESSPKYWLEPTNETEVTSPFYFCERPLLMGEGSNEGSYFMICEKYRKFELQYRENFSSWLPFGPVLSRDALVVQWKRVLQQGMYGNGARNIYYHLVLTAKACRALHLRNRFPEGRRRKKEENTWNGVWVYCYTWYFKIPWFSETTSDHWQPFFL